MDQATIDQEWGIIADFLPPGWQELARTSGALRRARKVSDPETLLRLILLHVGAGLSLRQAAARAKRTGLASISDVALLKRLRGASRWLQILAEKMFASSPFRRPLGEVPPDRCIRVVDATNVSEPGSTGTDWRIHYVLELPTLECDFFEVTDISGGETYKRLPVSPGDIILGDRGYSHRAGVAHVVDAGGDVVVRLNSTAFPLMDATGASLDLLTLLRPLEGHEPGEWAVRFEAGGQVYKARLCAVRKSAAAAEKAKQKILREGRKNKKKAVRPQTLELAEYVLVLTTLLRKTLSCANVLLLYRARWQIELAFKRIKSLFGAGHVPKYDPESARAWIHAKLLAVFLIERLKEEARFFSPWGFQLHSA
jgi:hypothetical protein